MALLVLLQAFGHRFDGKPAGKVEIRLSHMAGGDSLVLNRQYLTPFNEPFTPKTFRYYISNIALQDDGGNFHPVPNRYFLVDESEAASKHPAFDLKPGKYVALRFLIGVDSLKTVSGVDTGSLDPTKGMFWTWNTGYVAAKLEGSSPLARTPQQMVQYHIGGYRPGQNTLQTVTIPFAGDTLVVSTGKKAVIRLEADIMKWFKGKHELKIAGHAFVHTPGKIAVQYAENYAAMFRYHSIDSR